MKRSTPINIIPLSMNGRIPGPLYRNPPFIPSGLPNPEGNLPTVFPSTVPLNNRGSTDTTNSTAQKSDSDEQRSSIQLV